LSEQGDDIMKKGKITHDDYHCQICGAVVNPDKAVWLELDLRDNSWHDPKTDPVPQEYSQGGFPIGRDCAKKVVLGKPN
jgi:hypothetical protein